MKAFEVKFAEGSVNLHTGKKIKVNAEDFNKANELVKTKYSANYKHINSFVEVTYIETINENDGV